MTDFDLNKFLQQYKPKSLTKYLTPYMHHQKLKKYQLLKNHNKSELIPTKTYIKYINIDDADDGKFKVEHIKSGGILIGCGKMINNKFVESKNPGEWRYMMLKFDPSPIRNDKGNIIKKRYNPRIFYICVSKYYIFYRIFVNDFRILLEKEKDKIDVELKDRRGNII